MNAVECSLVIIYNEGTVNQTEVYNKHKILKMYPIFCVTFNLYVISIIILVSLHMVTESGNTTITFLKSMYHTSFNANEHRLYSL